MKKLIYIGIAVFALGMVSCSKQDIQPNSSSETAVPVWKSNDGDITDPDLSDNGESVITDPELEGAGGDGIPNSN